MSICFYKRTFVIAVLCLNNLLPATAFSQRIDSVLNIYETQFQQERIYTQFDKPAYTPGEIIWFKAYLMAGIFPSDISKNFYLDWSDEEGNILLHTTAPVTSASAFGQFQIPAGFKGSSIHVKAYTSWMLNFDSAFLFYKAIRVFQKNGEEKAIDRPMASIQFFAEGGDAITGISSKIAFKANDQYGKPVNVTGAIVNSKGLAIDSLKVMHDGMGYFFLLPQPNETYTAKWFDEQKVLHQTILSTAKLNGVALQINTVDEGRIFKISRSQNAESNLRELHIIATMQQQLVYMATVNLTNSLVVSGSIQVKDLPAGVLQFTLFDANWIPVAERISFVNNQEAIFYPEVGFSALGLSKRGRNMLVIAVPDSVQANLSVSVTDAKIGIDESDNIISHLLLTGDIKGSVYNATYYFTDTNTIITQNLDLIMLTHGWRRFNWPDISKGKLPTITYPADTAYLTLTGQVFGASATQLREVRSIIAILKAKDSGQEVLELPLRSDGRFSNPGTVFYDTLKVLYQFADKALADLTEVALSNGLLPSPKNSFINKNKEPISWTDTTGDYRNYMLAQQQLRQWNEGTTLKDVVVTTKVKSPVEKLDEQYVSGLFKGDAYQFDIVNDISANASPSVFNYLQGKVAGLNISLNGNKPSLNWRGSNPQVYLDEMPVSADQVVNISMTNVAYIKVFRPPFMGGFNGGGGAIAVYTRKGSDKQNNIPNKGLSYKFVAGYTAIKQFYSPNYGTFDQQNEKQDMRTTLYWNPMVLTGATKHTIRLEFYNNDISNSFRVVVEGMSSDGKLTRIEKVIE